MEEEVLKIIMKTDWSKNSKYDPSDAANEITSHVMEFIKWLRNNCKIEVYRKKLYWSYGVGLFTDEEISDYWFNNVKHGK